jgi:hypothetical protein
MVMRESAPFYLEKSHAFYESFGINYYNVDNNIMKTRHAEVDCLQRLKKNPKRRYKKLNLIVFRTNKKGEALMMAKPCQHCLNYYKKHILKKGYVLDKIYYTNENGKIINLGKKSGW